MGFFIFNLIFGNFNMELLITGGINIYSSEPLFAVPFGISTIEPAFKGPLTVLSANLPFKFIFTGCLKVSTCGHFISGSYVQNVLFS